MSDQIVTPTTGKVLRLVLEHLDVPRKELAKHLGVSPGNVTHMLNGKRHSVSVELSNEISKVVGSDPNFWNRVATSEVEGKALPAEIYFAEFIAGRGTSLTRGRLDNDTILQLLSEDHGNSTDDDSEPSFSILPFDRTKLRNGFYTVCADEVHGGQAHGDTYTNELIRLPHNKKITLVSDESIRLPNGVVARINLHKDLTDYFCLPSFRGHLDAPHDAQIEIDIKNTTGSDISFKRHTCIAVLEFECVSIDTYMPSTTKGVGAASRGRLPTKA